MHRLHHLVLNRRAPLVMPLLCYPGAALAGVQVRDLVTSPEAQVAAILALHERYRTEVLLTAMDLSVEAEAWGCPVELAEHGIPTVTSPAPHAGGDPGGSTTAGAGRGPHGSLSGDGAASGQTDRPAGGAGRHDRPVLARCTPSRRQ